MNYKDLKFDFRFSGYVKLPPCKELLGKLERLNERLLGFLHSLGVKQSYGLKKENECLVEILEFMMQLPISFEEEEDMGDYL